ncbi:MAG: type II CAAX endopeptidase family protein [Pseudomonadota bacterium]
MIRFPAHYPGYQPLIAAAGTRTELWRLILGLMIIATGYIAIGQFYFDVIFGLNPDIDIDTAGTPGGMMALLISFGCLTLAVIGCVLVLHGRGLWSLIGPGRLWWRGFVLALGAAAVLNIALVILPPWSAYGGELQRGLHVPSWLMLLPVSLLAVFIQTSAEELLFRGYLQQQLAARFASPWVWMVIPSALFALGHYMPAQAGSNAVMIAIWAGVFGLLMADLTARSGSLGPAMAVHFLNNVIAMLIISVPDDLNGLALYILPFGMADEAALAPWLWVDLAVMLTTWLAVRLALRR